jgi:hypothetical protein
MKINGRLVIAVVLIFGEGNRALGDDSIIDRMRICATEANEAKRLACYDSAIGRSQGASEDVGVTGQLLRSQRRQAGLTEAPAQDMSAKVVSVVQPPLGKLVVTLDNGQVWAQQEVLDFPLHVGDFITVKHGLFGAMWMSNGRRHLETRVQRIR